MTKIQFLVRAGDKARLLEQLRHAGAVHLTAVNPAKATADEATLAALQNLERAEQILALLEPTGEAPLLAAGAAAERAVALFREGQEARERLNVLARQMQRIAVWGDARGEDLQALADAGVAVRFVLVPEKQAAALRGRRYVELTCNEPKQILAALLDDQPELPAGAIELEPLTRDRASLLAEAAEIDQAMRDGEAELRALAGLREEMRNEHRRLRQRAQWTIAERGGLGDGELFALQGWLPQERLAGLIAQLRGADLAFAWREVAADAGETPPTAIRFARWTRPIEGLFKILGTVPGYGEFDVSGAFIVALPLFAAMLIADGGYGLLILLAGAVFYRRLAQKASAPLAQLILIIGACSVLWGVAIFSFFGLGDADLIPAGGLLASAARLLARLKLIETSYTDEAVVRDIMRLSFLLGAIHMSLAQLRRAVRWFPSLKAAAHVGWAVFLWGMLLVVNMLVLEDAPHPALPYLLIGGGIPVILFASPGGNPLKAVARGLAAFPLDALGTLSDIISYIRLMAVGLASSILAITFNSLAAEVAQAATWFAGALVLAFGHTLNIGLAVVALFAHGVRLNMLEFSKCLDMTWSGYPYEPFAGR